MRKGTRGLLVVVLLTAVVLTTLILGGTYLGFYVADTTGSSRIVMGIAFSTAGFIIGMAIIFRVIRAVVARDSAAVKSAS